MPDNPIPYVIFAAVLVCCLCAGAAAVLAVDAFRGRTSQRDLYEEFPAPPPASAYHQLDRGGAWRSCGDGFRLEQLVDAPRPRASIL